MNAGDAFIEYLKATEMLTLGSYSKPWKRRVPQEASVRSDELRGYFDTVWNRFARGGVSVGIPRGFSAFSFGFTQVIREAHPGKIPLGTDWYAAAGFLGSVIFVLDEQGCSNLSIYDLKEGICRNAEIRSLSSLYLGLASAIRSGGFTRIDNRFVPVEGKAAKFYREFAGTQATIVWE